MKIDEKLELILKAIRGEVKIELRVVKAGENSWFLLKWVDSTKMFSTKYTVSSIDELLNHLIEIREAKKHPSLTQDECEFLKQFPPDWWIAKDEDLTLSMWEEKPSRFTDSWYSSCDGYVFIGKLPNLKFEGIEWLDEDCYTIGELTKYAQEENK